MNPDTGHLFRLRRGEDAPAGTEVLPADLHQIANLKIRRDPDAKVNLKSSTPLAKWAKKKRLERIAAKSRRRNRK